jgi:hypothetical protein
MSSSNANAWNRWKKITSSLNTCLEGGKIDFSIVYCEQVLRFKVLQHSNFHAFQNTNALNKQQEDIRGAFHPRRELKQKNYYHN